ncbi:phage holin family protein [Specibacter cremeus]|uniref:phage holin family protein n=1 Tax=Specibacter cremeus TaxID=1629051 RepID=UPI000F7B775F|nr:phage holin family protein [Specibacter cremeus]
MGNFILRVLVNALALWLVTWLLPGVSLVATNPNIPVAGNGTLNTVLSFAFVGLIFGVVNALVKPIAHILALPVTILTLGLFAVVVNAAMLWLTAWLSSLTPIHFTIDRFWWTAIWAALIISVVSMLTNGMTSRDRARR